VGSHCTQAADMRYNSVMAACAIFCLVVLGSPLPATWAAQEGHVEEHVPYLTYGRVISFSYIVNNIKYLLSFK
jgi:hypothetical protein